jgi:hypothetical protein
MSSPGRYQSRLFNFVNRQVRSVVDQGDRAVRQVKVAAIWGVQILLYPVYLMVQTTRLAGRQIFTAAQTGWKPLQAEKPAEEPTPPTVDTPIERLLEAVDSWVSLPEAKELLRLAGEAPLVAVTAEVSSGLVAATEGLVEPSSTQSSQIAKASNLTNSIVQGVASLLTTRTLVLVSTQNQILDILTPQQQQTLTSRISWELADFWRYRRLEQASKPTIMARSLAAEDRPQLFPIVSLFWQVMAWVQTGSIAIAANLFQESKLLAAPQPHPSQPLQASNSLQTLPSSEVLTPQLPATRALVFLDQRVAELESHQLVQVSEFTGVVSGRTVTLLHQVQERFLTLKGGLESSEHSQTDTWRIQGVIRAAVDYFFGRRSVAVSGTGYQDTAIPGNAPSAGDRLLGRSFGSTPELAAASEADDPWLTWGDLFEATDAPANAHGFTPSLEIAQLPDTPASEAPMLSGNSIGGFFKRYFQRKKQPLSPKFTTAKLVKTPKDTTEITYTQTTATPSAKVAPRQHKGNERNSDRQKPTRALGKNSDQAIAAASSPSQNDDSTLTPAASTADFEHTPDWIETQATSTGYVKHPLELLLGWLDRAMLWLEELFVKTWRWVKRR